MNNQSKLKAVLGVIAIMAALITGFAIAQQGSQATATKPSQDAVTTGPTAIATFAGGCFWCMEGPYDKLDGVISTTSGYIGGHVENPGYRAVTTGRTGHTEAVQVVYNPEKIDYESLLQVFWLNIDPTVENRQFCDRGSQYRSGIFYHDDTQQQLALASVTAINQQHDLGDIYTEITEASTFYPAEDYHQDYYLKNPTRYKFYRTSCGRDKRLKSLWGDARVAFRLDS